MPPSLLASSKNAYANFPQKFWQRLRAKKKGGVEKVGAFSDLVFYLMRGFSAEAPPPPALCMHVPCRICACMYEIWRVFLFCSTRSRKPLHEVMKTRLLAYFFFFFWVYRVTTVILLLDCGRRHRRRRPLLSLAGI